MRRHELCCLLTHKAGIGSEQAAFAIMMSGTEDQKMKMRPKDEDGINCVENGNVVNLSAYMCLD